MMEARLGRQSVWHQPYRPYRALPGITWKNGGGCIFYNDEYESCPDLK
ncbi:MAG: hypothetical protein GXO81_10695 [Chlorobi bacterium]|nr:hypothetical protein [Chlorobiota bacterium]